MRRYNSYYVIVFLLVFLVVAPIFLPKYYLGLLILIIIYSIFAMSLDLLTGYTGLPSFGHAAFFGVSAYTVGILNVNVKVFQNFGLELIAGIFAAAITAGFFGLLALRSKGIFFLMITLALSMVLWGLASKWGSVTGGYDGLPGISRPNFGPIPLDLGEIINFYYFTLIFFLISVILIYLVVRSSFGLALLGIRESETRMSSLGYNVWRYKYISFILAGVFAGSAGILFTYYNGFIHPSYFGIGMSAKVLLMVILGGPGTMFGALIGAGVIVLLENFISTYCERWLMVLGVIYVIVVLFAPNGIYSPIKQFIKR